MTSANRRPPAPLLAALLLTWIGLVGLGLTGIWRHDGAPGEAARPQTGWPGGALLPQGTEGFTLVMAVHPHCPCSRASVAELARLMAEGQGRVTADVLFVQYAGVPPRWVETDTWRAASVIPGVRVVRDPGGLLARRFGARTSGQTYLYDQRGRLRFSGGITDGRGHEGDNAGWDAVSSLLDGREPARTRTPVFGCGLFPSGGRLRRRERPLL